MKPLDAVIRVHRGGAGVDVALEAPAAATVALLGPNGAGKSTIVDALCGVLPIDDGRIAVGDEVWDEPSAGLFVAPQRRSVGVLFQHLSLFPALTVLDNVAYGVRIRSRSERRARAAEALADLGAEQLAHRKPPTLSGGEAQRVALARALVASPRVLLLDEPLSALDVKARGAARALLKRVLGGFDGVRVLVTHDPLEAMTLADEVVVVEGGRVTQTGLPADIRRQPRSGYAAAFVGTNLLAGTLRRRGGAAVLDTGDGELVVVAEGMSEGDRVLASLHPTAITLSVTPGSTSARNNIASTVAELDDLGGRVRVVLEGNPPLVAEVTHDAVEALALEPGRQVWASVKATRIEVYPDQ